MAGNPIADGAIVEVKTFCYGLGQVGINVVHFKADPGDGTGTDQDLCNTIAASAAPAYIAVINEEVVYWGTSARILTGGIYAAYQTTVGTGPGDVAGDPLPTQICGIITKVTGLIGRKNRGRIYVPFPGEADNGADGLPSADYLLRLQAIAASLLAAYPIGTATTMKPVLRHADGTVTPIITNDNRRKWGQQHRRGSYGAANNPPF